MNTATAYVLAPALAICPVCEVPGPGARLPSRVPGEAMTLVARDEWRALNRAHEGCVIKVQDEYAMAGCLVADPLANAFDELLATGLLALGRPSAGGGQRVCVTRTGQARYQALCQDQTG